MLTFIRKNIPLLLTTLPSFRLKLCKGALTLIGPKENYVFHFPVCTSDTFPHSSPAELSMPSLSWFDSQDPSSDFENRQEYFTLKLCCPPV